MPNIYVMNKDESKQLIRSQKTVNYIGENNAESIMFLTPTTYAGFDLSKCRVYMKFDDGRVPDRMMMLMQEPYKGNLFYHTMIDRFFVQQPGKYNFHFEFVAPNITMKTGSSVIEFINK